MELSYKVFRKEIAVWWGILLCGVAFAVVAIACGPNLILSEITVEILGTLVGVIIALSLAEVLKTWDKIDRGKRLRDQLLDDIWGILKTQFHRPLAPVYISADIWEMGVAAGDASYLESTGRLMFHKFYEILRERNQTLVPYTQIKSEHRESKAAMELRMKGAGQKEILVSWGNKLFKHYDYSPSKTGFDKVLAEEV